MPLCAFSFRLQHWDTVRIKALAIALPATPRDPGSEDVQRIAHTRYAVYRQKASHCPPHLAIYPFSKPESQYQHRFGWDSQIPLSGQPRQSSPSTWIFRFNKQSIGVDVD
jgi:hypothetical protein